MYSQFQVTASSLNNIYGNMKKSYRGEEREISLLHEELEVDAHSNQANNLFDPNTFVELGMHISCVLPYQDSEDFIETYSDRNRKLVRMDSSIFGNVVSKSQRMVEKKEPLKLHCLRLRPLIGLYRKYCRADIEQLSVLKDFVKRG